MLHEEILGLKTVKMSEYPRSSHNSVSRITSFFLKCVTTPRRCYIPLCNSCVTIVELRSHHSSHSLPSLTEQSNVYGNIPKYIVISLYMSFKGQVGLEWVRFVCVMGWVNFLTQHLKDIPVFMNWRWFSLFSTRPILTKNCVSSPWYHASFTFNVCYAEDAWRALKISTLTVV